MGAPLHSLLGISYLKTVAYNVSKMSSSTVQLKNNIVVLLLFFLIFLSNKSTYFPKYVRVNYV
jgi:hypothetical protein